MIRRHGAESNPTKTNSYQSRAQEKATLVSLGQWALAHSEMRMVAAVTRLVQQRGSADE